MNGPANLEWLRARRSVRVFAPRAIERALLERILEAAITAPSSTNRQPWRFAVATAAPVRAALVAAVRDRTEAMKDVIRRSHHAEDFGRYGDFFFEPLETAAAIVVPQYREYPDLLAELIRSGGGDPATLPTASAMQAELCSTSAATMALLLQAHAEGLGPAGWRVRWSHATRSNRSCASRRPGGFSARSRWLAGGDARGAAPKTHQPGRAMARHNGDG